MGAVYGVFIASSTGSGKIALDGEDGHSPYTGRWRKPSTTPGEKLEDVFKSVRRQVRLATGEQQIPWESTSLELDFYFVPPPPAPTPAQQLLAAAKETGNARALRSADRTVSRQPRGRRGAADRRQAPAGRRRRRACCGRFGRRRRCWRGPSRRRRRKRTIWWRRCFPIRRKRRRPAPRRRGCAKRPCSTAPGRPMRAANSCRDPGAVAAARLHDGRAQRHVRGATIQGLRRASLLTDEHYLWYRPTMAALRALKKIDAKEGCGRQKQIAAPRCLRINDEDFCQ